MGTVALVVCSFVVLLGGSAVAARAYRDGASRAERALVALLGALALVIVPAHALAWLGLVSRGSLLGASCGLALASVAIMHSIGTRAAEALATALELIRLPRDAIKLAARERDVAGLGVVAFIAVVLWASFIAYLQPSSTWDGLWYHESIVGYTLQLGGMAEADVGSLHAYVNGYPRFGEYLQLWMVVAGEREWIDGANPISGTLLVLAAYVLIRRVARSQLAAIGFATALGLMPGVALQFRSTLIDVTMAAFAACALCFATRPVVRARDLLFGALALGLLAGTKATGVLLAGAYGAVLAVRFVAQARPRLRASAGPLAAALALVLALGAPSYARNYLKHGNPLWPLGYESKALHIAFKGKKEAVPHNRPFREVVSSLVSLPEKGRETFDTRDNGYGNVMPFTVLPLAILAALALLYRACRALVRRAPLPDEERLLLIVLATALLAAVAIPAIWWARFHIHVVLAALALCAWLLRPERVAIPVQALIFALVAGQLATLYVSKPGWGASPKGALNLARKTRSERFVDGLSARARMPTEINKAFEAEIGAGDVVATDGEYLFLANLWNRAFSNRVVRADCSRKNALAELAQRERVKWVFAGQKSCIAQLKQDAARWQQVGRVNADATAYRRRD